MPDFFLVHLFSLALNSRLSNPHFQVCCATTTANCRGIGLDEAAGFSSFSFFFFAINIIVDTELMIPRNMFLQPKYK